MLASSYELKNTIPLRFEAYLNVKIPQYPTNKAKTVVIEMEYKMPSIKCKRLGTPGARLGMLVVFLRVVNFGFCSHLACSGQNTIIFKREGLV